MFVCIVVSPLSQAGLNLLPDLNFVKVPSVCFGGVGAGGGVGSALNPVDLGLLSQEFVSQLLGGGQDVSVVLADQVLHKLLQLVPVHLKEGLGNGYSQPHCGDGGWGNQYMTNRADYDRFSTFDLLLKGFA